MMENKSNIKSIVKAGKIIDVIAYERIPISLSDLSKRLDMAKSTLHGLLSTLVDIGYLEQVQESGKYKLGVQLFELGSQIMNTWSEKEIAQPYMEELARRTSETVHLAMLSNGEVLYVDKKEGNSSIRIVTAPGVKLPAHCTGVGKTLLAFLPEEKWKDILDTVGLQKYTSYTITKEEMLYKELDKIRRQGYAYDNQEYLDGLRCISAPIFDNNGRLVFALSISGPLSRMSKANIQAYLGLLLDATKDISKKLGYRG
ncbi:MAG: IclR family transcriptional regulator [Coprobacillaceae bacterium]